MNSDQRHEVGRALVHDLSSVRRIARDLAASTSIDDCSRTRAGSIARTLKRACDNLRAGKDDRAPAIAGATALAAALAKDLAPAGNRDCSREVTAARTLAAEVQHLYDRVVSYPQAMAGLAERSVPPGGRSARYPTRSARWIAGLAARLLPAADRERYCEEFRSELWDLAGTGIGRRAQLACTLRQLLCVLPLRLAGLAPRHRNALP